TLAGRATSNEESRMATSSDESMIPRVCLGEDDQARRGRKQWSVLLRWGIRAGALLLLAATVIWIVVGVRKNIVAQAAQDNFREVAQAMLDYAEQHGQALPTQAIYDKKTGKPLLSWRVTILPQLGEEELYKEIHLEEAWDSPHNRQFWGKMPAAFELPGLPASKGLTAGQGVMGPETGVRRRVGRKLPGG